MMAPRDGIVGVSISNLVRLYAGLSEALRRHWAALSGASSEERPVGQMDGIFSKCT
jgi:hypothetical protein